MRPMNSNISPSAATPLIDKMIHEVVVFVQKLFGASSRDETLRKRKGEEERE
jgi:hypothetical protein